MPHSDAISEQSSTAKAAFSVELEAASRLVHKHVVQQDELLKDSEQALSLKTVDNAFSFTDPRLLLF
jgi:hypothetical protein